MRRSLVAFSLAAGVVGALATAGAASAGADGTPVTFAVSGLGISITQPAAVNLGPVVTGATVSGSLGSTVVNDQRGSYAGWTVNISGTDFTDTHTPTPDTITVGNASVWVPGVPTTTGAAVPTVKNALQASPLTLSGTGQALVTALTAGNNTVTYSPSIQVAIPAAALAGTYTGTVTQTVS